MQCQNKSELLEGKRQTIASGDWLREVAEMKTDWVSEWTSWKYGLILFFFLDFLPLYVFVSHLCYPFSHLISMEVIRDRNSYLLTSLSIKASAMDKLKNVNKKTKQASERAKKKRNTHDSCRLILSVIILPNTSTLTVFLYIVEYRSKMAPTTAYIFPLNNLFSTT